MTIRIYPIYAPSRGHVIYYPIDIRTILTYRERMQIVYIEGGGDWFTSLPPRYRIRDRLVIFSQPARFPSAAVCHVPVMAAKALNPASSPAEYIRNMIKHCQGERCQLGLVGKVNAILEQAEHFGHWTTSPSIVEYVRFLIYSLYCSYSTSVSVEDNSTVPPEERWALICDLLSEDDWFDPPLTHAETLEQHNYAIYTLLQCLFEYFTEVSGQLLDHDSDYLRGVIDDIHALFSSRTVQNMILSQLDTSRHTTFMIELLGGVASASYAKGWFHDACSLIVPIRDLIFARSMNADIVRQWCEIFIRRMPVYARKNVDVEDHRRGVEQALKFVFTEHCTKYLGEVVDSNTDVMRTPSTMHALFHRAPILTILLYKIARVYYDDTWIDSSESPSSSSHRSKVHHLASVIAGYAPSASVLAVRGTFYPRSAKKMTLSAQEILKRCASECAAVL